MISHECGIQPQSMTLFAAWLNLITDDGDHRNAPRNRNADHRRKAVESAVHEKHRSLSACRRE
jgi:hypothetical protein